MYVCLLLHNVHQNQGRSQNSLAAANLYRKSYTLLDAAAFWLQPAVVNFDVSPKRPVWNGLLPASNRHKCRTFYLINLSNGITHNTF